MLNKYLDKEIYRVLLFSIIVLIISYFANYFEILFYRPQSIHFIRQTDSLSFVKNYYENGMHFFSPQTFNLITTDGKAACEFPILYYLTAILYFIFGEHEFILRLINISIVFIGFYYVTKLSYLFLKDWIYSFLITFLVMSSSIVLYYANNFLPDIASLGFSLIGLFHFINYTKNKKNKSLIYSYIFLTLAGLLKPTYMIFSFAIIGLYFIELIGFKISNRKIYTSFKLLFSLSLASFLLVFSWYFYAISYNKISGDTYFLTNTTPMWKFSQDTIFSIFDIINKFWKNDYYPFYTFYFIYLSIAFNLIFYKNFNKLLKYFLPLLVLGGVSYFVLFFEKFKDHDYYILLFLPIIVFIFINSTLAINNFFNKKILKFAFYSFLLLLIGLSTRYGINNTNKRYTNEYVENYIFNKFEGIKPKLDSLKIDRKNTFIVIGDYTRNGSLYFMDKRGWTIKDTSNTAISELKTALKNDPNYLITTEDFYLENNNIKNIDKELILTYNKMNIYKLH